ncbi:MAG TPA: hypothetical protein DHW81_03620 [Nitrospiraceae bacterium]|nr:hypothetical protein [Nitrospiraceae bacterium]
MEINFFLYVKMKKAKKQRRNGLLKHWSIGLLLFGCLFLFAGPGLAGEISVVDVRINNNDIYVTTSVKPDRKFIDDMNNGISKELVFYIDLFRVWNVWPDEFVTSRKLVKTLKSNPIKRENVSMNIDGNIHTEKRFKDIESMIEGVMNITDIKLTNTRELEPGSYFVKVSVESKIRKLPPVIGYLLFFVPEKETSISKNSATFQINVK